MSRASSRHRPDVSALPARLTPSGPETSRKWRETVARHIVGWEVMGFNGAFSRGRQTVP